MGFITFIYRVTDNPKTYYGKYSFNRISDDHEGLDKEVLPLVVEAINQYRRQKYLNFYPEVDASDISIGILSFCIEHNYPTYSSEDEIKMFDFYCKYYDHTKNSIKYINGKSVEYS